MNRFIDQNLYDEIKSGTNVVSGEEYKQIVYAITQLASDMVVKTLGPYGKTTILNDGLFTYPSKDGWAAIKLLNFNDPVHSVIFATIRQISFSIVEKVGDGTTSALVGANAFLKQILEYQEDVQGNFRQSEFVGVLEKMKDVIVDNIKNSPEIKNIDKLGDFSDIKKIAMIASNGNDKLSSIIQKIYQDTNNPNMYVTLDRGDDLSYEIQRGYKFESLSLNHPAYINTDEKTCVKKDRVSLIAIFDHTVSYNEHGNLITSLSHYANSVEKDIVIIAPYFDDIMSNIISTNIQKLVQAGQIPNIMLLQFPIAMDIQKKYLADVAMLTNAQFFDYGKVRTFNILMARDAKPEEEINDPLMETDTYNYKKPMDVIDACLGKANTLIVGEKFTILQDYETIVNTRIYHETMKTVKERYEIEYSKANKSSSMLDKDFMNAHQRYVRLMGNMGVIKVGGNTELERHFLKDVVDDATLACRSAYNNGYIRGLNLTTLTTIDGLRNSEEYSDLENDVLTLLFNTFYEMSMSVISNKYPDRESKRGVCIDNSDKLVYLDTEDILETCIYNGYGYNLVTEELYSINDNTIINSISTDIEILNAIVGTLSLILTSDQFLSVNRFFDKKANITQIKAQRIEERKELTNATMDAIFSKGRNITQLVKDIIK